MLSSEKLKETRAKRAQEKAEKTERKALLLNDARQKETKTPGYQRLRANEYDRLRKERANGRSKFNKQESIAGVLGLSKAKKSLDILQSEI